MAASKSLPIAKLKVVGDTEYYALDEAIEAAANGEVK
jgi:hypothetical protein